MSKYQHDSYGQVTNQYLNEEYFDLHPTPWDVETWEIREDLRIFYDHNNPETFLLEITFKHWKEAEFKRKVCLKIFKDLDVYRINKKLFLRKLLF